GTLAAPWRGMGMGEAACSLRSPLNRSRLSRGHALKTDQTTRELDLAHVPEPVLVEPALEAIEHGDAVGSRAARAVGAGDRRRERPGDDDAGEVGGVDAVEVGLGPVEDRALVVLERL